MKFNLEFEMTDGEYWYGGQISDGTKMPVGADRVYKANSIGPYGDQSTPLFLSSMGRYIWSEDGYIISFENGKVRCESDTAEIKLYDGYKTLRGAFLAASKAHFPPDGNMPDELMFRVPQYCTWIEMFKFQTQKGVLGYAKSILDCGMPAGEIIIDDGWQKTFGDWRFKENKFPDPKGMVKELHDMGFKVIMWCVPFIDPKAPDFEYLKNNNCLVKDSAGNVAMRKWWDATSAVLDYSEPKAREWFSKVAQGLIDEYGIDGFKQDAGDNKFYRADDITAGGVSPNQQGELWMQSGLQFGFNEFRASWKGGGIGVAQRLGDKSHSWKEGNGLRALIPNMLLLGLSGHPFGCPDMIGGGLASDFNLHPQWVFDHELFIRWAQCSTLMPMMQYSISLWRFRNKRTAELTRQAAKYHLELSDYIVKYANDARKSGEPIVRFMEYSYPHEGMVGAQHQFLLGDDYLVAPVVYKKMRSREVMLPKNTKWQLLSTGDIYEGGDTVTIDVPLEVLPIFKKLD